MSGVVRRAFKEAGHEAYSCDLEDAMDGSHDHYKMDVTQLLKMAGKNAYDLIIAHPPCTYLTVAGNRHYAHRPELFLPAVQFAVSFFDYSERVAVENPVGRLSTYYRRPDQSIQPYEFGDNASKRTCLWLKGLPRLNIEPTKRVAGRMVEYPAGSGRLVERWENQTDSGQNKLGPSADRAAIRSLTYPGIAAAMVAAWG